MVDVLLYLNPMLKKKERIRLGFLNIEALNWKIL